MLCIYFYCSILTSNHAKRMLLQAYICDIYIACQDSCNKFHNILDSVTFDSIDGYWLCSGCARRYPGGLIMMRPSATDGE